MIAGQKDTAGIDPYPDRSSEARCRYLDADNLPDSHRIHPTCSSPHLWDKPCDSLPGDACTVHPPHRKYLLYMRAYQACMRYWRISLGACNPDLFRCKYHRYSLFDHRNTLSHSVFLDACKPHRQSLRRCTRAHHRCRCTAQRLQHTCCRRYKNRVSPPDRRIARLPHCTILAPYNYQDAGSPGWFRCIGRLCS